MSNYNINKNNISNKNIKYENELSNTIRSETFNKLVDDIQNDFRLKFSKYIIKFKQKTHYCQEKCYSKTDLLIENEKCADKCYTPLFSAHQNIMNITDDNRKKLEDCRFKAYTNYEQAESRNFLIKNCLKLFKNDLELSSNEIDFIFKGYYKKLEELI